MKIDRREFLQIIAAAALSGMSLGASSSAQAVNKRRLPKLPADFYELPPFGDLSLLHLTDVHAQLLPVYFREPSVNIGVGKFAGQPPHLVGQRFLDYYQIPSNSAEAYAFTYLNFTEAARHYGKLGGYAHIATLVKNLRVQRPHSLLLDGGDTWQGSATALWTNAQDMVNANLLLGVDVMTGHWEFTFGAERLKDIIEHDLKGKTDFVAQNIIDNEFGESVFQPYVIKELNQIPVAIIGQAFPYTPIANPRYMIPDWSFGIREENMQAQVNEARSKGAQVVVLLSHNGMDVDIKLASRVTGIDAIMGGHTHDAIPKPVIVNNKAGKTLVINSGSAGKFLSVLDLKMKNKRVSDFRFKLLPVFSNHIPADKQMQSYIDKVRQPFLTTLNEELAISEDLLYRRGTFNGSFDQIILDALLETQQADIALSPGFRWGMNVLPGEAITYEDVMTQTAITYPMVTSNLMSGERLKMILEDVADNIFHSDPYLQQGGDMVRVGGLQYSINPAANIGRRISDMVLKGKPIEAKKLYKVAGWANVSEYLEGIPIWDVVANYLRDKKTVSAKTLNLPKIRNLNNNPGIA